MKYKDIFINDKGQPRANYFVESRLSKKYPEVYADIIEFCKEINIWNLEIKFQQKLYHFLHNLKEIPKCPICGEHSKFAVFSIGYRVTCSNKACHRKYNQMSREKSNLEKYGVKNVFQLDDVKEKVKDYQFEKYGTWQIKTDEFDYKKNETNELKEARVFKMTQTINTDDYRLAKLEKFKKTLFKKI